MDVKIVEFPETLVAALEHRGAPDLDVPDHEMITDVYLPLR